MAKKIIRRSLAVLVVALFAVAFGCYSYKPPPHAIRSDHYTTLGPEETFEMPGEDHVLEIEEAQDVAVRNNPTMMSSKHAMSAAWSVFYQSLSEYLPKSEGRFQVGGTHFHSGKYRGPFRAGPDVNRYGNTISLDSQYLLFDGLVRTMNMMAAWHGAKESEAGVKDAHRLLRQSVSVAYNNILLTRESMRIAKADLDFNLSLLSETEIKYDAGAKALVDVLNFRINATQSNNALIELEYLHRISRYTLAKLMGLTSANLPENVEFPPLEDIQPELLTDVTYYLDLALRGRPDLEEYRRRLNIAEYRLYASWGRLFPSVYFDNRLAHGEARTRAHFKEGNTTSHLRQDELSYGGSAEWVMFQGGRRLARIREAQALVVVGEFDVAEKWISVVKEVRQAYNECQKNARLLILYQKIQKDSLRYRDLIEENYKSGNAPITEINQAQWELTRNEALLVRAQINILNSRAQLLAAIGAFSTIPEEE